MSGRLVGEVAGWLRSPAAAGMTLAERAVLLLIAERANERNREMWSHRGDGCSQFEYLCETTGLKPSGLTEALKRLAARELETRIQIGSTKSGAPVFAHRGKAIRFRLPELPASVELPEWVGEDRPITPDSPVDNPGDDAVSNPPEGTPEDPQCLGSHRPIEPKGSVGAEAFGRKGSVRTDPSPSKEDPSKEDPSTPKVLSSLPDVEDNGPPVATPSGDRSIAMGWEPTYREASALLQTLPDLGGAFMAAAEKALSPGTSLADRVIYAGRLAKEAS